MSKTTTIIGPSDHGRHMSLDEVDLAEGREGHGYELARGIVTVVEVPNARHLAQLNAIRRQIHAYDSAHPGMIHTIAGGGACKTLIAGLDSERHPDLALYKTSPPDEHLWSQWVPEIVFEVVLVRVAKRQEALGLARPNADRRLRHDLLWLAPPGRTSRPGHPMTTVVPDPSLLKALTALGARR